MPKQIFPISQPQTGFVYDDESAKPSTLNLDHLSESFRLADLLEQLGHSDAAECVRPVHILGDFQPMRMVQELNDLAQLFDRACIACVDTKRLPHLVWHPAPNGVNELTPLRLAGGHVLGLIGLNDNGVWITRAEPGPDEPLSAVLLNGFASTIVKNPAVAPANELLNALDKPNSFDKENIEKTLDVYSEWTDRNPVDIHEEIHTVPVQRGSN